MTDEPPQDLPQDPKPKKPRTEAQKRAQDKYYAANKEKWIEGYNQSESAKEARKKYEAEKRGSRPKAQKAYRDRVKAKQNKGTEDEGKDSEIVLDNP